MDDYRVGPDFIDALIALNSHDQPVTLTVAQARALLNQIGALMGLFENIQFSFEKLDFSAALEQALVEKRRSTHATQQA